MVAINTIRSSNAAVKQTLPSGLVALFVGATSGIGENTMKVFYENTNSPRVYFVGRSQAAADKIIESLKELNPDGSVEFIKTDASLIKNIDEVTQKITEKEKELNLLFMSQGYLTPEGRVETEEGLDTKLSLNYFSRARLIQNLLPLLTNAAKSNPGSARVVSVLSAGFETPMNFDDYELKTTFSLKTAMSHATASNSAIAKYLAKQHPTISFMHTYPGGVATPIIEKSQFPGFVKTITKYSMVLFKHFITSAEESGQRHFWLSTNEKFKTGGWLVDASCEESAGGKKNVEKGVCDDKIGEKVWKLNLEMFERVKREGKA